MENQYKVHSTIDLFKIIAAVLVVFIHANTTKTSGFFNMFNSCFTAFCVPFFFLVSGYFFQSGLCKSDDPKRYFLKYEKKTLGLYAGWAMLSLPDSILFYLDKYSDQSFGYTVFVILRRYLLCGQGVYWYILITAESAAIIYLLVKYKKDYYLWPMILIGLVLGFLYDNYSYLNGSFVEVLHRMFYAIFSWSDNFIMKGIPFMGLGYFASKYKDAWFKMPVLFHTVSFIAASVLNVLLYNNGLNLYLFFIVQAIAYFAVSIRYQVNIQPDKSIIIRELSSCIYFLHTFFLYYVIEKIWGLELFIPVKVLLALLMCSIVFVLIKLLSRSYDLKFINFLFNIKNAKAKLESTSEVN